MEEQEQEPKAEKSSSSLTWPDAVVLVTLIVGIVVALWIIKG